MRSARSTTRPNGAPAYYMVNCAHPTHFAAVLDTACAVDVADPRRSAANASSLSHAELDAATELDRGDIAELAALYDDLHRHLDLRVIGGCCGTDHEHVSVIANALLSTAGS